MTASIEVRDLAVSYGGKRVLANVTTRIEPNRIRALVGPSGVGKTTFLTALNRLTDLIPGAKVGGSVRLAGTEILGPECDVVQIRRRIGMLFQKPSPFPFSIRANLDMPLKEHGMKSRAPRDATIERSLRDVGLWDEVHDRLDAPATGLSGGQQQRLCIARAVALQPEVILFDEPCSALDPMSSAVVEDLIVGLKTRYTIVVVTHNLAQARRIADDVSVFWWEDGCGTVIEEGSAEAVFDDPRHALTRAYVTGARG